MAYPGWGTGPIERTVPIGPRSDHFIVCGANTLAHRLVIELTEQYGVPVVAIVPDRDRDHGPQIVQILGDASVISAPSISEATLQSAEIATARGIALVDGDDQSNIHTALRAQENNRDVRIVLRIYNQRLGGQIQQLFPNCAALSGSATAAPAFVNAALRRPNSVPLGGRSVSVAFGQEIRPTDFLCTVADRIDLQDFTRMRLLPDGPGPTARWIEEVTRNPQPQLGGRAVLQFLDSEPKMRPPRLNRLRWRLVDMVRFFTGVQLRLVLSGAVVTVMLCFALMWWLGRPFAWAVYQTLLDLAGSAVPDTYKAPNSLGTGGSWQRLAQVAVTLCGIPLMAVVTAVLVENTGRGRHGALKAPSAGVRDHVVVVGLGNVGSRIVTHLHRLGVPVVCIERDQTARGIGVARSLEVPVLVGEGTLNRLLSAARIETARALLAVTGDDATNLEAALEARAIQPDVRIVMRLFDDDFAAHVYRTFKNAASRSVSYLAAPGFAAALMGREVLGTLSVYRRVVLIAQFEVRPGSRFDGRPLRDLEVEGELRVIALLPKGATDFVWRPDHGRKLVAGDLYAVLATGLGVGRHTRLIS